MEQYKKFYIITGGPGSGKTTLLNALKRKGYAVMPEAGRAIIKHQTLIDGPALPWKSAQCFAEAMLTWDLRNYQEAKLEQDNVFFDRGLPDLAGYLYLSNLDVPAHFSHAIRQYRYNPLVFIAPAWKDIYHNDRERKQDFALAEQTFLAMRHVYKQSGYQTVTLPCDSIEERLAFIHNSLSKQ